MNGMVFDRTCNWQGGDAESLKIWQLLCDISRKMFDEVRPADRLFDRSADFSMGPPGVQAAGHQGEGVR